MSEIRCPKCDSDKTEISNFRMGQTELRYCRECYVYWTDWQQSAIASRDATIRELQEENAHLIDELAMSNSMVGDLKGCCDHGCLIQPPTVGTNSGKCYCTQGKVRGYIGRLREEISRLEDQVRGALAYTEIMAKGRKEIEQTAQARIEKLENEITDAKAFVFNMTFPRTEDDLKDTLDERLSILYERNKKGNYILYYRRHIHATYAYSFFENNCVLYLTPPRE